MGIDPIGGAIYEGDYIEPSALTCGFIGTPRVLPPPITAMFYC
jgi:hypothetical protein